MSEQSNIGAAGQAWAHSFEEDEGDVRVYRPRDTFPFPPTRRGRETLVFDAAGRPNTGVPGRDDRIAPQQSVASFDILEAGPDKLRVKML